MGNDTLTFAALRRSADSWAMASWARPFSRSLSLKRRKLSEFVARLIHPLRYFPMSVNCCGNCFFDHRVSRVSEH